MSGLGCYGLAYSTISRSFLCVLLGLSGNVVNNSGTGTDALKKAAVGDSIVVRWQSALEHNEQH